MTSYVLPTFLLGPALGARRNQVLAQSIPSEEIASGSHQRLLDLPLAIATWMDSGEAELFACIPMSADPKGERVLLRANYVGELQGEPYGFCHAILIPRELVIALDGHCERLLPLLPAAAGNSGFAANPLRITAAELPPMVAPVTTGLEWENQALVIRDGTDRLALLAAVLAGVGHHPQSFRVCGWATSFALPGHGSIDPGSQLQLLIGNGDLSPPDGYRILDWNDGALIGTPAAAPPTWAVWHELVALVERDPFLAPLSSRTAWAFVLASDRVEDLPGRMLQRAAQGKDGDDQLTVKLLEVLADAGLIRDRPSELLETIAIEGVDPSRLLEALLANSQSSVASTAAAELAARHPEWTLGLRGSDFATLVRDLEWCEHVHLEWNQIAHLSAEHLIEIVDQCASRLAAGATGEALGINLRRCTAELLGRPDPARLAAPAFGRAMMAIYEHGWAADLPQRALPRLVEAAAGTHQGLLAQVARQNLSLAGRRLARDSDRPAILAALLYLRPESMPQ